MPFNDRQISGLKPKGERYQVKEDGKTGLGIRVTPEGVKTWFYQYRFEGRERRLRLGTYPATSLAEARARLIDAKRRLEAGEDPQARKDAPEPVPEPPKPLTVAEFAEVYIEMRAKPRKKSWRQDQRLLSAYVLPALGERPVAEVGHADIAGLLDRLVVRTPIQANRVKALLSTMLRFAISRGIRRDNPARDIEQPAIERPKERVLRQDEIATLWRGVASTRMAEPMRIALKLILATMQRPGEVVGLRMAEIGREEDGWWWTIPGERAKNGRAHRVPLSPLALDLIGQADALRAGRPHLFPSPRPGQGHLSTGGLAHALASVLTPPGAEAGGKLQIEKFTAHDLRRTAATHAARIGTMDEIVSRLLGHTPPGPKVTGTYNRHRYDAEKRAAMLAWEAELLRIVGPAAANDLAGPSASLAG
ncbi:MAG TPA: integrase arm-type DNA-binding domain-containing protein [Alphaproteobacteria bacterium]|nr:integrase arm-type DNA-binding domain-containing protein [Alphaproteobacteria bacterium]